MAFACTLHEEAHKEYVEAYEWYESRQEGLGDRFMFHVETRLKQISEHPEHYSKKHNNRFREAKVENFPYMVAYEFFKRKQIIHIASIYHSKRHPRGKYRNLKSS